VIVTDASVAVDLLLNNQPYSDAIIRRIREERAQLAAPYLIDAEVAQILRRFVRQGKLSDQRALNALQDYADIPLTRYPHLPLLVRAFELRNNVTVYDALYIVLAQTLDAPLITRDRALANVAGHAARVEVIE
jgi:predicted nucleic acid-binding protein